MRPQRIVWYLERYHNIQTSDATAYRETGRHQALEGKAWTSPTLAHGRLYLRDQDELVCFDLRRT